MSRLAKKEYEDLLTEAHVDIMSTLFEEGGKAARGRLHVWFQTILTWRDERRRVEIAGSKDKS